MVTVFFGTFQNEKGEESLVNYLKIYNKILANIKEDLNRFSYNMYVQLNPIFYVLLRFSAKTMPQICI